MKIINKLDCFIDFSDNKNYCYIYGTDDDVTYTCDENAYFWFSKYIPFEHFHLIDWELFYLSFDNLIFSQRKYKVSNVDFFEKYDFTSFDFTNESVIKEILIVYKFISKFESTLQREKSVKVAFEHAINVFYVEKLSSYTRTQLIDFLLKNFDCSKERFYMISNF